MKTFRFYDFEVYKLAKVFYKEIILTTETVNTHSLKEQSRRAALSIILNIAEGSAKKSDKDFARYLQNSLGSVNEVVACLDVMKDNELITQRKYDKMIVDAEMIAKQLGGFIKKLYSNG